jgi:hypothetical protein
MLLESFDLQLFTAQIFPSFLQDTFLTMLLPPSPKLSSTLNLLAKLSFVSKSLGIIKFKLGLVDSEFARLNTFSGVSRNVPLFFDQFVLMIVCLLPLRTSE